MSPPAAPRHVLVVVTRQIGDVLLTTPLIRAARDLWPQARIDVLGFTGTLGMLRGNPDIGELIEAPPRLGLGGAIAFARRLWRRYDLAVVADIGDRAHLIAWIAARQRSGIVPEGHGSNWWKRALLDHVVVAAGDRGGRHVAAEKLELISPWSHEPPGVPQVVPPGAAPLPDDIASSLSPGCVVVHAPSMWDYKQWPLAHYERVVRELLAEGRQVVLTGSASERDRQCIVPLRALGAAPQLLDVSGRLNFNQLTVLLRSSSLYIGPDTSVSHLAAATGVPMIAIFGPTNPMRWGPWPAELGPGQAYARMASVQTVGNVTLLQSCLSCVPCGRAGCEDHRQSRSDCLIDIGPERVLAQARRLLQGTQAQQALRYTPPARNHRRGTVLADKMPGRAGQWVDAVYVLSVKSFGQRIAHITAELERHGIPFEFVFEHDASEMDAALVNATFGPCDLGPGQQSLVLKNIQVWRTALERGWRRVLVFEDDAVLHDDFGSRMDEAIRALEKQAPGWLLFLGGLDTKVPDRYFLAPGPLVELPIATTEAYVCDAEAMRRRLAWLEGHRVTQAADFLIREVDAQVGVKQFWLRHPIVEQGSVLGVFDSVLDKQRRKHSRAFNILRNRWNKFQRRRLREWLVRAKHIWKPHKP